MIRAFEVTVSPLVARLLVVDGSAEDCASISRQLRAAGHDALCAADAAAAISILERTPVDAVITEWKLPDTSALDLAIRLRASAATPPRILVSSRGREPADIASALDSGIDDYLVKTSTPEELVARVNAVLRRPAAVPDANVRVGPVLLDRIGHRVTVRGHDVALAPAEFRLMAHFMEHRGRVLSRKQLLTEVWQKSRGIGPRTVDVHVRRLRAVLQPHGCDDLLQTVRGFGYRFG
jgi:two-component system phosphate regulon response regulator PhoB